MHDRALHPTCCVEGEKPSWTARLLSDPALLCKKVREEAGELCQTLEANEGESALLPYLCWDF